MNETKITTANVRIMLSHNYSNFEVQMNLVNENGISKEEIDNARKDCQQLATMAVNEYKTLPSLNPKTEILRVENKIAEIKKMVEEKKPEVLLDPKEVETIKKMPLYKPKK